MKVVAFAPELLETLRQAASRKITIKLNSRAEASYMRSRLHSLRTAMYREHHSLSSIVAAVQISISNDGTLIAQPPDAVFLTAIHNAGIKISEGEFPSMSMPPISPLTSEKNDAEIALESFFTKEPE